MYCILCCCYKFCVNFEEMFFCVYLILKGYLVASHLDNDDLLDVWQCLTSDGVLNKTLEDYQPPQVVFWKEVHLTRLNQVSAVICFVTDLLF